ncbi:hypothetical protein CL629_03365 [bacterium]|nr:hypothetical protein [bacterium]|tara:strand:+ start:1744 stop:2064 length:321 start_codon:yes stop_codon:yes gene_type:complete
MVIKEREKDPASAALAERRRRAMKNEMKQIENDLEGNPETHMGNWEYMYVRVPKGTKANILTKIKKKYGIVTLSGAVAFIGSADDLTITHFNEVKGKERDEHNKGV